MASYEMNEDEHKLTEVAAVVLSKKSLLHQACVDNGLDVPELDSVNHRFLLDVYGNKVFVLRTSQVRYMPPRQ